MTAQLRFALRLGEEQCSLLTERDGGIEKEVY